MQSMLFLVLLEVKYSVQCQVYLKLLMNLAGADVFGGGQLYEWFFIFSINKPLDNHFD